MAKSAAGRVNSRTDKISRSAYKTRTASSYAPAGRSAARARRNATERNRSRALSVNKGYILFLVVICAATVFMCVQFLQFKATVHSQQNYNEKLESKLVRMKAENDALYESVINGVDLEAVRDKAVNRYGMHYASQDQIIWYNADNSGYVRQIRQVPYD